MIKAVQIVCGMCFVLFFCFACSSTVAPENGGSYFILAKGSEFCIDVPGATRETDKQLIVYSINNTEEPSKNQVWILEAAGTEGEYKIRSESNNMYLSVRGASLENASPVVQLPAAGTRVRAADAEDDDEGVEVIPEQQIWKFERQGGGFYSLVSKLSSMALTVTGDSTKRGALLAQYEKLHDADTQAFRLQKVVR